MSNVNKTAIAGAIFFSVILAGFVALKIDQTTVVLLGSMLIGVIAAVTTTLIILIRLRKPDAPKQPAQSEQDIPILTTHNYYDNRRVVVVVNMPANTREDQYRFVVSSELRVAPSEAQRLIDAGEVKCLPAGSE